ncbi:MAG: ATP-dependent Clp protease adaptor ClpS [Chloroflexi bacterium]|nr:ATP-dependent Clp protease adaptor ClpS [Chloroflexota bacterium]MDA1148025.1 ATP-dependent Clp protease adaptor ClpS [Chloroflexota bacterium]
MTTPSAPTRTRPGRHIPQRDPQRHIEERPKTLDELFPPATVVLHNDDVNSMEHVIHALLASVPEVDLERAAEIMLTAHNHGQADVISCPLERAELYRDRLESHGLTATIRRS